MVTTVAVILYHYTTVYKYYLFSIKCRINTKLLWRGPLVAGPDLPYPAERPLRGPTDLVR